MVAPLRLDRVTVGTAADRFTDALTARMSLGQLSENTRNGYGQALRDFVDLIGPARVLDDVTGEDVDTAIASYARSGDRRRVSGQAQDAHAGKSVASQQLFYATLRQFFREAVRQRWVQVSPLEYAQLRPGGRRSRGELNKHRSALTMAQAQALIEHGAGDPETARDAREWLNMVRDRVVFTLLVVLGPRVSELVAANVSDFTPDRGDGSAVWTIHGKGGKARRVPVSEPLYAQLRAYHQERRAQIADGYLPPDTDTTAAFSTSRGNRLNARAVQRSLEQATYRLSGAEETRDLARGVTPHALRHTAATIMLANGWDVKVVSDLLGHDNIATTSLYLDQIPGELEAALASHPLLARAVPDHK